MVQFDLPEPADDGLFIPDVGPWSRDKHHFLRRYLDAFTWAMRDKPWAGLHYIDLFAGAGLERIVEDEKVLGLDWGSPLIAAQNRHKFDQLHLVELEGKKGQALRARLDKFDHVTDPQLIIGDANSAVIDVLRAIPLKSLSVAFLDPYGLHLHFETLRRLAKRRVDLIVFFPDHVDALRNWEVLYESDLNSNLDLVLGRAPWRELKARTPADRWAEMLSRLYVEQIGKLGYTEFEHERINRTDGRPLYKLIFCSRSPIATKIWRGVSNEKPGGQKSLDFG